MKRKEDYEIRIPKKYECCKNCEYNAGSYCCCPSIFDPLTGESLYGVNMKYMHDRFFGKCLDFEPSLDAYLKYGECEKSKKTQKIRDFMLEK